MILGAEGAFSNGLQDIAQGLAGLQRGAGVALLGAAFGNLFGGEPEEEEILGTDVLAASIAFSTGMTCMPMPAPPGGTSFAASTSGSCGARLNIVATSG